MRVAVVAEWYPSPIDPVHGVWAHRQAVAARDAGADVRVIAARRPIPPLSVVRRGPLALTAWSRGVAALLSPWELDGISIASAPFISPPRPLSYGAWGHWLAPSVAHALDRLQAQWPFDLLHAHCVTPAGFAAARWSRRHGRTALAVSTHGPDVISVYARSRWARQATRFALGAADVVIANSSWAAGRCEEIARHALPTEVVHLGADLVAGPPARRDRRERPAIVTVGHLVARKRHAVVLHALATLPEATRPDYLVIGDGPGLEPLAHLASELGIADRVQLVGQLEHQRALAEMAGCQLYVMPSVEEPFGVAYVEAMAAGLPVIGARGQGGPEDIAAAGGGIVLVSADDHRALAQAIAAELQDPDRLAAQGAAARETVASNFTWTRCGERTLEAYRRALAARTARS